MTQRRRNNKNQEKSKKNGKIMRCTLLTRPVFEEDTCNEFIKNINKEADSNCRNCRHSFWYNINYNINFF